MTADPEMMRILGNIESGVKALDARFTDHKIETNLRLEALDKDLTEHKAENEKRFNFIRGVGAVLATIWGLALAFGVDVFKAIAGR